MASSAATRLVVVWTIAAVIILATLVLAAVRSTPNAPGPLPWQTTPRPVILTSPVAGCHRKRCRTATGPKA
ncbi:hypothetical protein ACW0JT_07650 [Arthrobacter sp. SA17]